MGTVGAVAILGPAWNNEKSSTTKYVVVLHIVILTYCELITQNISMSKNIHNSNQMDKNSMLHLSQQRQDKGNLTLSLVLLLYL